MPSVAKEVQENFLNIIKSIGNFDSAMTKMLVDSEKSFSNMKTMLTSVDGALSGVINLSKILGDQIPFSSTFIQSANEVKDLFVGIGQTIITVAEEVDKRGESYRGLIKQNYEYASSFGYGIEKAVELTDRISDISKVNSQLADSGLFISTEDTQSAFRELSKNLKTSSNEFLEYSYSMDGVSLKAEQMTAVLQEVSGIDQWNYYSALGNAVAKSGMSFEEAIMSVADYKEISKETGIGVNEVSSALSGAVNQFAKLGLTVDFAKPALVGFASVLKEAGLGIENASSLTQTLSTSLMDAASSYGKAYVLFQQGGLDFGGGGGVLGASIGFRASMMNQTPEQQEATGMDLMKAMKDTISNFTGGSIITLQEAAKNPALQQQYYAQEQMLSGMFGISGQADQQQTLSLLQSLDEATKSGDRDRAAQLADQLNEGKELREKTSSLQEKLGAIAAGSFSEHVKQSYLQQQTVESLLRQEGGVQYVGGEEGDKRSMFDVYKEGMEKLSGVVSEARNIATEAIGGKFKEIDTSNIFDILKSTDFSPEEETGTPTGTRTTTQGGSVYNLNLYGSAVPEGKAVVILPGQQPMLTDINAGLTNAARAGKPIK
jgi:hypothetical protein